MTLDTPTPVSPPLPKPSARLFAVPGRSIERHLVIVHQPGWQAVEDWYGIANKVIQIDPTIAVFVVPADSLQDRAVAMAAKQPTLVFSAGPLGLFAPARGKAYHGRVIPKIEQVRRLAEAHVPVPLSTLLRPGLTLDPAQWGGLVIVKPTDIGSSSHGSGITLMRTERVRYIPPNDYPAGHPGRVAPMMVQRFVDTGEFISVYRVLTLFGQPLYCQFVKSEQQRVSLDADDTALESSVIAIQGITARQRSFTYDADAVALATRAYKAIPEAPLQGCDVIREASTGRVYVLELNPGGNTWHFSSSFMAQRRAATGVKTKENLGEQLDAFATAAHVLAQRTREEAV
jgi:hypothetical protein